jgi:hypothetical protein
MSSWTSRRPASRPPPRKYGSSVDLLWMHLNGYGHEGLSEAELERFERAVNEDGDEEAFCHIFGPEKIVEQIPQFLYWFMLRKVMARESDLRAAATTSRKLARWLVDRGYVSSASAELALEASDSARNDLPAADRLSSLLYEHAGGFLGPEPPQHGARGAARRRTVGDAREGDPGARSAGPAGAERRAAVRVRVAGRRRGGGRRRAHVASARRGAGAPLQWRTAGGARASAPAGAACAGDALQAVSSAPAPRRAARHVAAVRSAPRPAGNAGTRGGRSGPPRPPLRQRGARPGRATLGAPFGGPARPRVG